MVAARLCLLSYCGCIEVMDMVVDRPGLLLEHVGRCVRFIARSVCRQTVFIKVA